MVNFGICEGNPGALTFLLSAYDLDMFGAEIGFGRMDSLGIRGSKLYMLWNDCCGRDTSKAIQVMKYCDPFEINNHINYEAGRGIPFADDEISEAVRKAAQQRRLIREMFF